MFDGMAYPLITLNQLQIGSVVIADGHQYKVADYNNYFTKKFFEERRRRTFAMIKPNAYPYLGQILNRIVTAGFYIKRLKTFKWTLDQAQDFYIQHMGRSYFESLTKFASSDICVGLELISDNAVEKWRKLMGPKNSEVARVSAPYSLRALYGIDAIKNAVHGSDSPSESANEIEFVFGSDKNATTAILKNCSCLFVKPHAIEAGNLGLIVSELMAMKFKITAMEQITLTKSNAEDFFKSHKEKLPEFRQIIEHVISGSIVVMEVSKENAVRELYKVVGPYDPEEAVRTQPDSIR